MLVLHILAICLAGRSIMYRVEAAISSVRITTIPSQGPFRLGQTVQFSCDVEPAQSAPLTYKWRTEQYEGGGNSYSSEIFNITYDSLYLRYHWYFCSIILNGRVLGSADKLVEIHGLLQTDEPITRAFSLNERMVMRIHISDYKSHAQYISSLAWYHNGTELTSDDRVSITNNGTSLTISNMTESDAGKYEVKINSLGSDPEICDRNILPMLENYALYAPVTFLLQESNLPRYNAEDIILDYALLAYHGTAHQSFAINKTIMVNTAILNVTKNIVAGLHKDGVEIRDSSTYNISVSYNSITISQSLRIFYNNTDDIAGHYQYILSFGNIIGANCPDYYNYIQSTFSFIPTFTIYWNIKLYDIERGAIKRGANPPRLYTNGCPSEEANEDILVDVLKLLSSEFGVVPLGRAESYAAISCQQVADASRQNKAGLYWLTDGTNTRQEYCNF